MSPDPPTTRDSRDPVTLLQSSEGGWTCRCLCAHTEHDGIGTRGGPSVPPRAVQSGFQGLQASPWLPRPAALGGALHKVYRSRRGPFPFAVRRLNRPAASVSLSGQTNTINRPGGHRAVLTFRPADTGRFLAQRTIAFDGSDRPGCPTSAIALATKRSPRLSPSCAAADGRIRRAPGRHDVMTPAATAAPPAGCT